MAGVRTVESVADFEKLLGDAGGYENNFTLLRSFLFFGFPQILVTICVLTLIIICFALQRNVSLCKYACSCTWIAFHFHFCWIIIFILNKSSVLSLRPVRASIVCLLGIFSLFVRGRNGFLCVRHDLCVCCAHDEAKTETIV